MPEPCRDVTLTAPLPEGRGFPSGRGDFWLRQPAGAAPRQVSRPRHHPGSDPPGPRRGSDGPASSGLLRIAPQPLGCHAYSLRDEAKLPLPGTSAPTFLLVLHGSRYTFLRVDSYPAAMCRYGMTTYKSHYVCLPCRRTLKADPLDCGADATPRCPECAKATIHVGRDFAAPRRRDDRGWRALAAVLDAGLRFDSCGCNGPGARPRTPAAVRARTRYAQRAGKPVAKALSEPYGVY